MYRSTFLLLAAFVIVSIWDMCASQTPFCDIDSITENPAKLPLPSLPDTGLYSALIEKNNMNKTSEYREYYDGKDNVGVVRVIDSGEIISFYYHYETNELLIVKGSKCVVHPLDTVAPYLNGGFQVVSLNGSEHIMTPLNAILSNPGFQAKYIGDFKNDRGIWVNRWAACAKSKDNRFSIRIGMAFTNPDKFIPPSHTTGDITADYVSPVEFVVETKDETTGVETEETYYITNFRTFSPQTEEFYLTRSGVFCDQRNPGRKFPEIPNSFVYYTQVVPGSDQNTIDEGIVDSLIVEYNSEFNLYGRTYHVQNSTIFELRDYQTGLNYDVRLSTNVCKISNVLPSDQFAQMNITYLYINDPNQFFNLTGIEYQFVGTKRMEGLVEVDVWIGKGKINGVNVLIEWYFLNKMWSNAKSSKSSSNSRSDDELPDQLDQKPLMLKVFIPDQEESMLTYTYSIFGFRLTGFNLVGFDIKACHPDTSRRFFMFRLHDDLIPVVRSNEVGFKEAVVKILQEKARVSVLRVSRIEVAYDDEGVYVFFTLYDRVKQYGPLAMLSYQDDTPLNDAVKLLEQAFLADQIQLMYFSYAENSFVFIPVIKESLREVDNYEEGFVMIKKERTKAGLSTAVVALCTIIIGVLGLTVGYFLIVLHNARRINIPMVNKVFKI